MAEPCSCVLFIYFTMRIRISNTSHVTIHISFIGHVCHVWTCNEIRGLYDKTTITKLYQKNITCLLVGIGTVTCAIQVCFTVYGRYQTSSSSSFPVQLRTVTFCGTGCDRQSNPGLFHTHTKQVRLISSASLVTIWSRNCFLSLYLGTWSGGIRFPCCNAAARKKIRNRKHSPN